MTDLTKSPFRWVHPTDDTTWLDPESTGDLEWKLRHGRPAVGSVAKLPYSNGELLVAASALACYRELVRLPRRDRDRVIAAMRRNRG